MFLSPVFPAALVWANAYVEMTAVAVSVPYVGSAVGGMVYQYLIGFLFDKHGEETLMNVVLGYAINLALVYIVLQIVALRHGKRSQKEGRKNNVNNACPADEQEGSYVKYTTEL